MALDQLHQNDSPSPSVDTSVLEGPFLHADDAAYWAHRHIGAERSVEYGGVILKKGARFFASIPQPSTGQFVLSDLVTVSPEGKLIFPYGYTPYAFYHSHPTQAQPAGQPAVPDEMWSVYSGMFSYTDIERIIENGSVVPAHYLSGPGDALIKYVVSGSIRERELVSRLRPEDRRPFDFFTDYVPMMAGAGELSVVLASKAWGGIRGRVGEDWRMGVPLVAEGLQPLFEKITSSPNFGDLLWERATSLVGYQLKSIDKEEYLVTVKEWEPTRLTPPAQLFSLNPDGGVRLPANFRISSLYCWEGSRETPGSGHFFSPTLLAGVAEQLHTSPELYVQEPRLRLVMLSGDGALLSYRFSASDSEVKYLGRGGATVNAQLKDGRLTPRHFVSHMAGIGELETLRAGSSWLTVGRVLPEVTLVDQLRAAMSPAFVTADDAARYLHDRVRDRSGDMLGLVFQRNDGRFVSTPPISEPDMVKYLGPADVSTFDTMALPPGYRVHGFFVAHSLFDETQLPPLPDETVRPQLSPGELAALSDAIPVHLSVAGMLRVDQKIPAFYHSSSLGSLVKYVRSGSQAESAFGAFLQEAIRTGAFKVQLDGFDGTPIEMVKKLARLGEFSVLVTSRVWGGSRGQVPANWAPFKPFVAASPVPPLYSWIFQDAPTAATYGHDQLALTAGNQSVVFILKGLGADEYVAALAGTVSGSRVFSGDSLGHPVLVSGFELHGMCFSSRPALGQNVQQRWLYECFVAPAELAVAIAASREAGATVKTLYWNTRDGAQLEYQFSGTALESQLYGVTPTGAVTDNGTLAELLAGKLTPSEFVMRVAAAGRLSVMKAGTLWDVVGRVDERWKPFASYPQPALSAPFLTADDAARFAHEQIGSQRYGELCGLILKTADQRFVATLPRPCRADDRFAIRGIFAADHAGALILPPLHTLYGQYASCRALAMMGRERMVRYRWSRTQALIDWQLFADVGLRHIMDNRHGLSVAYLSSAEDALIAYDVTASASQRELRELLEPGPQGSALDAKRAREELGPQDWVRKLAATGLRIVQGNPLWGRSVELADDWQPFAAETAYTRPDPVAFGAIFSSVEEAVLDAHSRQARSYATSQTDFRFVLKHGHKDAYVVSEAVPCDDKNPLLNVASLFKTDEGGRFIFPTGFTLYGLFYARQWMPESLLGAQRWLARYFLSSLDLSEAFSVAKRWRDKDLKITLPVYISTLDNALLQFQTPVATRLFDAKPHASGSFEDVHTLLASGQLTAKEFVRKVIAESWLSVIQPSECWDETGKLGADWVPFADFSRRALSPAFLSEDDAARYAKALIKDHQDHVYGGLILRRGDGRYVATEPLLVTTENFDPKWILPDEDVRMDFLAPGMNIVARYRSRPDTLPGFPLAEKELSVYRNMFSTEVLGKALECNHLWRREYLFGPDGSVISFTCDDPDQDLLSVEQRTQQTLSFQQFKQVLSPSSRTPHNPQSNEIEQQLRDGLKTPTEYVNLVLKAASMTVVEGNTMWGSARKLPAGWFYSYGFTAPEDGLHAIANRALSPVFSHIDDVARFAHHQAGARTELRYGYILKSANDHWIASLPVKVHNLRLSPDQVFFRGQLPTGWTIQGLYLCAPTRQPDELTASPVYRSFIPPRLLSAAIGALTRTTARVVEYMPLYLSCADGALLSYRATSIDGEWGGELRLQSYVQKLNAAFNPADYIRQVARAGELKVLRTGEIWATSGTVGPDWLPRQALTFTPGDSERVALGPLFAHADDAARYQWRRYRHERNTPRLAALLANTANDTFLVTEALVDSGLSAGWGRDEAPASRRLFIGAINPQRPARDVRYPKGYRVMGVQQLYKLADNQQLQVNRFQQALADNFIGQPELSTFIGMFRDNKVTGARYYFTPRNGALLLYLPSFQSVETNMLFSGWVDPTSEKQVATPSQVITVLINSGRMYILQTDTFWQPRGHVATRLLRELRKGLPG